MDCPRIVTTDNDKERYCRSFLLYGFYPHWWYRIDLCLFTVLLARVSQHVLGHLDLHSCSCHFGKGNSGYFRFGHGNYTITLLLLLLLLLPEIIISLVEHVVQGPDVVFRDLYGLELAELPVVAVSGQEVSQTVEGCVESAHAVALAVVGVQTFLSLLLFGQYLGAGASLLGRGGSSRGNHIHVL